MFALLALLALPGIGPRLRFDRADRLVSMIADLESFGTQAAAAGIGVDALLARLRHAGVTHVTVAPVSLADLEARGLVSRAPAARGASAYRTHPGSEVYRLDHVLDLLGVVTRVGDRVEVAAHGPLVHEARLFLPHDLLDRVAASGLSAVLRLKNAPFNDAVLRHLLEMVPLGAQVLFDDKEALGYPAHLRKVAELLAGREARIGLVEFSGQRGVTSLAALGKLPLEPVHSIPEDEMAVYTVARALPRWVRAVTERRIRALYLRPFPLENLPFDRGTPLEGNLRYLEVVRETLEDEGFRPGVPLDPAEHLTPTGKVWRIPAALAAGAAAAWVLAFFHVLEPAFLLQLMLLLAGAAAMAGGVRGGGTVPNLLALLAGCCAPAAAVLQLEQEAREEGATPWLFLSGPLTLFLASALAGVVIACLMTDPGYLTRALEFRGVKLIYLAPLALVGLAHLKRMQPYKHRILASEVAVMAAVALAGFLYVARSGNTTLLPASAAEHALRDRMEAELPYRPRTKEVAVGYPALGAMLLASAVGDPFWVSWTALGATVAGVSATNSFCHLRAPFAAGLGRGAVGLGFGLLTCLLGALVYQLAFRRSPRRFWVVAGYAGFGNFGDDALTRRLLAALESHRPAGTEIVVLVPDPARAPRLLGARGVHRYDLLGILFLLRNADLFATGPGGLVQDRTSFRSAAYYLGLHALASLLGVPRRAFLGEGFGPLASATLTRALRFYASTAHLCLVRDPQSRDLVGGHGVVGPDLFFLPPPGGATEAAPPPERRGVGLCLRALPEGRTCFALPLARALAGSLKKASRGPLRLLAAQPGTDRPLLETIARALEKEGHEVTVEDLVPGDAEERVREMHAVVSMRLHGCFLAIEQAIPLLALPYDPKVAGFLDETAYPFRADPEGDPKEAAAQLEALLEQTDSVSRALDTLRKDLQADARGVAETLGDLVGRTVGRMQPERDPATTAPPSS